MLKNVFYNFSKEKIENNDWDIIDKFSIEGINNHSESNEKSCTHLSPFVDGPDNTVLVLKEWYTLRRHIFGEPSYLKIVDELPTENQKRTSHNFKQFYKLYLQQYDYAKDMQNVGNDVRFVNINLHELKEVLTDIFFTSEINTFITTREWYQQLAYAIDYYGNDCFVRGERVSAKNDSGKNSISSVYACLLHLGKSKDVLKSLCEITTETTYIAIMKWNPYIKLNNEFRVFVIDGKIKAISQQKWYIYVGLTKEYVQKITPHLYNGCLKILEKLNYLDASMDVWIDEKYSVHLIEVNPGGRWCCSASLLFNWTDEEIWQDCYVHVRYVTSTEQEYNILEID